MSKPYREHAIGPRNLERLYAGALQIQDPETRLLTCLAILCAARLGMRLGEIVHLREEWIDWQAGVIKIPEFDACACNPCWDSAHKKWLRKGYNQLVESDNHPNWDRDEVSFDDANKNAIVAESDITSDELLEFLYEEWSPKTESGARTVVFGASERLTATMLSYFSSNSYIDESPRQLQDLLEEAAEYAPGLDADEINFHGLRSDGITFFTKMLSSRWTVRDMSGHSYIKSTMPYWTEYSGVNIFEFYTAAGKQDWAPPVVPENPGQIFPVMFDPVPFEGEYWRYQFEGSPEERMERAEAVADEEFRLRHPRDVSKPDQSNREGFPDVTYRPQDHPLPGVSDEDNEESIRMKTEEVRTLHEFINPHDTTRPESERKQFRVNEIDNSDDRDEDVYGLDEFSGSGVGAVAAVVNPIARDLVENLDQWIENRLVELSQWGRGLSNLIDPTEDTGSFSVGKESLKLAGAWAAVTMVIAVIMTTTGFYDSMLHQVSFAAVTMLRISHLPWDEINVADLVPAEAQEDSLDRDVVVPWEY